MKLTCAACGATGSIEFFLMDAAARQSVVEALAMPAPLNKQIMPYIGLFRPNKRALTWDRVERLLEELVPAINEATIERHGRTWPAPIEYWKEALDQILMNRAKLNLPLKSHGYLFEIVAGMSSKAEGRVEARQEESKRHAVRAGGMNKASDVVTRSGPPEGWKECLNKGRRHAGT